MSDWRKVKSMLLVSLIIRQKNNFYKFTSVNNQQVQVFIDIGSQASLITKELAQSLHLKLNDLSSPTIITVFGGL